MRNNKPIKIKQEIFFLNIVQLNMSNSRDPNDALGENNDDLT